MRALQSQRIRNIFSEPSTMFTTCNIATQFGEDDPNSCGISLILSSLILTPYCSHAELCYAEESLKVKHVVVMGHDGCGGVASMVAPPPQSVNLAVQNWIYPIRQITFKAVRRSLLSSKNQA